MDYYFAILAMMFLASTFFFEERVKFPAIFPVLAKRLAPVAQTLDSAIHRINHYPADSFIDFRNTYPLDSDLSRGQRYPTFEQPRPDLQRVVPSFFLSFGDIGTHLSNLESSSWL